MYVFYCLNKNRYGGKNMFSMYWVKVERVKRWTGRISMVSKRA